MPNEHAQPLTATWGVPEQPLERVVGTHPFARGLPPAYHRVLAACGAIRDIAAGQYLWRQGDRNVEAYLVLEGELALEITVPHEGTLSIETVGAGDVAGCPALFHSARWGFDGRAVTALRTVVLNSRSLRAAIECDHELGYQLLERCTHSLVQRLNASRVKLVEAHSEALP